MSGIMINKISIKNNAFKATKAFQAASREAVKAQMARVEGEARNLYVPMVKELTGIVQSYIQEFEHTTKEYIQTNNLTQMAQSLSLNGIRRSEKIIYTEKEFNKENESTEKMMRVMLKGHTLLLQMRKALTGQNLKTKFYVETDNGLVIVDESKIDMEFTLSKFGAGTVSNPFSLAYNLSKTVETQLNALAEQQKKSRAHAKEVKIYEQLAQEGGLKRAYLDDKSKVTGREYAHIFFDSKDAEIMNLYFQMAKNGGAPELTLEWYRQKRSSMGGRGGYASAFYKIGDTGLEQVKFFSIRKNQISRTVNFARFSLLRDRFQELLNILQAEDRKSVLLGLSNFFTEKGEHFIDKEKKITDATAYEMSLAAQKLFEIQI